MKRILTVIIILTSLFITTCDDIALGTALNLNGPVVEITGPVSEPGQTDPQVGTVFNFFGTASSESKVSRMSVTITYYNRALNKMVLMGREYKWEDSWQTREGSELPWSEYNKNIYKEDIDPDKPAKDPSWSISGKTVNWNLPVYMVRMEKGQYFITVTAWDSNGNSDANSNKRIKVEFNNKSPTIKFDRPLLLEGSGTLGAPKPPSFSGEGYLYDPIGNPSQTYSNLKNFTNKFKELTELRWTSEHTANLVGLSLEITNEHNLDKADPKKITYFSDYFDLSTLPSPTSSTHRGVHKGDITGIGGSDGAYIKIGQEIKLGEGDGDYSAAVSALPKNRITPLQIVTKITDITNLKEYKSKGWFLWLPDSDKPFVDIAFGYKVRDDDTPPVNAPSQRVILRGSSSNTITLYDDDGLAGGEWKLYKLQDNSLAVDTDVAVRTGTIDIIDTTRTSYRYDFKADYSFGVGRYKIEVTATDIYGTKGNVYTAYFTIETNSAPEILNWTDSALATPDGGLSNVDVVWGDADGTITITGKAAIECSDGCDGINHVARVNRVSIVLINYDISSNDGIQNVLRYTTDSSYSGWDLSKNDYTTWNTDTPGNRVWEISPSDLKVVSGSIGNNGDGNREVWEFTKKLNWFTDLKGDITNTGHKYLYVRALSTSKTSNKDYYGIKPLTIRGDDTPPVVAIQKITIHDYATGTEKDYTLTGAAQIIPAIKTNDKVKLSGIWSDKSREKWTNLSANQLIKLANSSLKWNGNDYKFELPLTIDKSTTDGGKWETGWSNGFPTGGNTDPLVTLSATLTDRGGNPGEDNISIMIETNTPTLSRISSERANGRYGPNSPGDTTTNDGTGQISIFLGFNKSIKYDGTLNASTLSLQLSNGKTAPYVSGFGTDKIVFRYTILSGDSGTEPNKLNVTNINFGTAPKENWKSIDGTPAVFPLDVVTNASNTASLAQQKSIYIDVTPPTISTITTTALDGRTYGKNQQIVFTVDFNEDVDVSTTLTGSASPLYLSLGGGTFTTASKAYYTSKAGTKSVQFVYTVPNTDNSDYTTSAAGITISSLSGNTYIKDKAGNSLANGTVPNSGGIGKNIKVETRPPAAPTISGINNNTTYYDNITFNITNLIVGNKLEYHTDYTAGVTTTGWIAYDSGNALTATSVSITLSNNGEYKLAARQIDKTTPENTSLVSNVITGVKLDKGAVLTKISSTTPDGTYSGDTAGTKDKINIDLEFRIPVWITVSSGANITLNTGATVSLPAGTSYNNTKKLTVVYTISAGATTPGTDFLDVTAINFGSGITISDKATDGTDVKPWVTLAGVPSENRLNKIKEFIIITGLPAMINSDLGTTSGGAQGTWFTGTELGIKFNRQIYRGKTATNIIVRQIAADFRIPAVLTEQKFNDIFSGRDSMFSEQTDILTANIIGSANSTPALKAAAWKKLGDWLYEKGSNGATRGSGTGGPLTPDTSTKYVLRFSVNTINDASTISGITGVNGLTSITMAYLADLFRAAEALTFGINDPNVKITDNDRYLRIDLSLPVKGATYEWIFPNGFVQDILSKLNGNTATGTDNTISGTATARQLKYTGASVATENPVIRIDKGDDLVYFATDSNGNLSSTNASEDTRQARQKLLTKVKMDCRTPGATIKYWRRYKEDKVQPIIMRTNPTNRGNRLPNLGTNDRAGWENVRMRPQSGVDGVSTTNPITGANWTSLGLNHYSSVINTAWSDPAGDLTYTPNGEAIIANDPNAIGSLNYSDGGFEYNYRAWASSSGNANSGYIYETAYRSVLVVSTMNVNGNGTQPNIGGATNRLWIRGSNTTQGDPTISDFPISRNPTLWRKIKLMTPITPTNTTIGTNDTMTESQIPATQTATGYYLWFWVTWKINVPAFVDIQVGRLPTSTELGNNYPSGTGGIQAPFGNSLKKFFQSFIPSIEHYAVHPGRTTVVETRDQGDLWDGAHGTLILTVAEDPIGPPTDY